MKQDYYNSNPKNNISKETQITKVAIIPIFIWALLLVAIMVFCRCSKQSIVNEETNKPAFSEWHWADCLPSAMPIGADQDCPGDKPLWEIYNKTSIIVWRYEVFGRTIYKDEYLFHTWRIYDTVYCLNANDERVGTHYNLGFKSFEHAPDPVTGLYPHCDDVGVINGVLCIFGVIKDGKVAPRIW